MRFLLLCLAFLLAMGGVAAEAKVKTGIDVLLTDRLALVQGKRIGLVTNHSGVDSQLRRNIDMLRAAKAVQLVALFSPEHGIAGQAQAGVKVASTIDAKTGLPVYSLYGTTRDLTAEMLAGVDLLLFDMQDAGARYYTYPSTLLAVLRAAAAHKIPVIILDRPNPLGGASIEGPVLEEAYRSFVGIFPMAVRHGMTIGELGLMFAGEEKLEVDLTVVPMQGWRRGMLYRETQLAWVPPSPNLPTPETALVYPGTALFEGTNVSEGRGTANPFEQIGAPFVDGEKLADQMNAMHLPGVRFRPVAFTPTSSKFAGQNCNGVMAHVTNSSTFQPVLTGTALVQMLHKLYPGDFQFIDGLPPFFDKLAGTAALRSAIVDGHKPQDIAAVWGDGIARFRKMRKAYLLYR
jgi:uncharacterized protein YbbC (DUF1343 family)